MTRARDKNKGDAHINSGLLKSSPESVLVVNLVYLQNSDAYVKIIPQAY